MAIFSHTPRWCHETVATVPAGTRVNPVFVSGSPSASTSMISSGRGSAMTRQRPKHTCGASG